MEMPLLEALSVCDGLSVTKCWQERFKKVYEALAVCNEVSVMCCMPGRLSCEDV